MKAGLFALYELYVFFLILNLVSLSAQDSTISTNDCTYIIVRKKLNKKLRKTRRYLSVFPIQCPLQDYSLANIIWVKITLD